MPAAAALARALSAIPPASGALVMGTGIVSVALLNVHQRAVSRALLVVAAAAWVFLGIALASRALSDRARLRREARTPAALTAVAATAVLGARVIGLGWIGVADALMVLAALMWLALLRPVLRAWSRPAAGVSFMVTVSTQSLAVLAAQLAVRENADWLLYLALVLLVVGLVSYAFVLASFDFRQLLEGHGDHWVSGGALAISALAAARVTIAAHPLHQLGGPSSALKTVSLVLWGLSVSWLPALLAAEVLRPRPRYDLARWATVFPVGMYAATTFDVGIAAGVRGLVDFAQAWVWVSFGVWVVVFAGMLWRGRAILNRPRSSAPPPV